MNRLVKTFALLTGAYLACSATVALAAEPERWGIVVPAKPTQQERGAAEELRDYLSRIYAGTFIVEPETETSGSTPAIYVGATQLAKTNGCHLETFAADEFVMKRVSSNLILCGGAPRGTFNAVTQFLEEYCDVRWLTPFREEHVPKRSSNLDLPEIDRHLKPAFVDRDLLLPRYGFWGWYEDTMEPMSRWLAFNHVNGKATPMHMGAHLVPERLGGHISSNTMAHSILNYLPADKHYSEHPEFYALQNGKRTAAGLCKSNQQMRDMYFGRVSGDLKSASERGETYVFHISDLDGPVQPCECAACKGLDKLYGDSSAGQMLDFMNYLAERSRTVRASNVKLETLAYSGYETPPAFGPVHEDLIIRFAPIFKRHWDRMDSPCNSLDMKNLQGWCKLASDVRVWDYPHQCGSGPGAFGLSITESSDKGLNAWVELALKDRAVALSGLHLSLAGPVTQTEHHYFAGRIAGTWERELAIRPTLIIQWREEDCSDIKISALTDCAAAIADSKQTISYVPGLEGWNAGGIQLAGTWEQTSGHRICSFLRFDFQSIPQTARLLDAELVLSRIGVVGNDGAADIAFRAVQPGQIWKAERTAWDNQPKTEDKLLFTMRLAPRAKGYDGYDALFPQPNLRTLVHNIRFYRNLGVKGVFMETHFAGLSGGLHCDADLVYWVLAQALWNPERDADDLIDDFCHHYYGPGGEYIAGYTKLLESAYRLDPYKHSFHVGNYSLQSFLNFDTVSRCQILFDRAEKACGSDTTILSRIRRARLSIDVATLFNFERLQAEYRGLRGSLRGFPFERQNIESRYRESRLASTRERFPGRDIEKEGAEIDKLLEASRKTGVWSLWRTVPPIETYYMSAQEKR